MPIFADSANNTGSASGVVIGIINRMYAALVLLNFSSIWRFSPARISRMIFAQGYDHCCCHFSEDTTLYPSSSGNTSRFSVGLEHKALLIKFADAYVYGRCCRYVAPQENLGLFPACRCHFVYYPVLFIIFYFLNYLKKFEHATLWHRTVFNFFSFTQTFE